MARFVGWNNILYDPDLEIISEESKAGFPFAMCADGKLFKSWRPPAGEDRYWQAHVRLPVAVACDYWAIAGSNIGETDSDVIIEYSLNGGSTWNIADSYTVPEANKATARIFTEQTAADWRFTLDAGLGNTIDSGDYLSVLHIGKRLDFNRIEAPFTPPGSAQSFDVLNNISQEGLFIGRSNLSKPFDVRLELKNEDPAWIRANIPDFVESVKTRPFFFVWDSVFYPNEVAYCWTERAQDAPRYPNVKYMNWTLRAKGRLYT